VALKRLPLTGPLAILVVLGGLLAGIFHLAQQSGWLVVWFPWIAPPAIIADGSGTLLKVRDGDTVEVRYHDLELAVRLRCVDTAESVHPDAKRNSLVGDRASAWAKEQLLGQSVRVEFTRKDWHIELDRYGRALGYLWIDHSPVGPGPEDVLFNELLIRQGFSTYITTYGTAGSYHGRFSTAEAEAKREKRGLWQR
jgi:endonuclease YncB( thermonuclease family)